MPDKYHRLVTLVVDICTKPLLTLLLKYAKEDTSATFAYTNIHDYLKTRKDDLIRLTKGKIPVLKKHQLKQVLPQGCNGKEGDWDVTILSSLLLGLFHGSLQTFEKNHIQIIQDNRNRLKHRGKTYTMTDGEFDNMWTTLSDSVVFLTKAGNGPLSDIQYEMREAMTNALPGITRTMIRWSETTEKECMSVCGVVNTTLLERSTKEGHQNLRFKSEDHVLERLRESYKNSYEQVAVDFVNVDAQVKDNILDILLKNNHVVVTGYDRPDLLTVALAVTSVKDDYVEDRCAIMALASDWRHIDPNEIDVVVCRHPFGHLHYDSVKTKDMFTVFDDMLEATKRQTGKLCIIVITRSDLLERAMVEKGHGHELLRDEVRVIITTADENGVHNAANLSTEIHLVMRNLLEQSSIYLKQTDHHATSQYVVDKSINKLETYKTLVVMSSSDVERMPVVKAILSLSETRSCVVMTDPTDFRYLQPKHMSVLVIEDFPGRHRYDLDKAHRWYEKFELLFTLVKEGLLKVIFTCDTWKLKQCEADIGMHPILQHWVQIPLTAVQPHIEKTPVDCASQSSIGEETMTNIALHDTKGESTMTANAATHTGREHVIAASTKFDTIRTHITPPEQRVTSKPCAIIGAQPPTTSAVSYNTIGAQTTTSAMSYNTMGAQATTSDAPYFPKTAQSITPDVPYDTKGAQSTMPDAPYDTIGAHSTTPGAPCDTMGTQTTMTCAPKYTVTRQMAYVPPMRSAEVPASANSTLSQGQGQQTIAHNVPLDNLDPRTTSTISPVNTAGPSTSAIDLLSSTAVQHIAAVIPTFQTVGSYTVDDVPSSNSLGTPNPQALNAPTTANAQSTYAAGLHSPPFNTAIPKQVTANIPPFNKKEPRTTTNAPAITILGPQTPANAQAFNTVEPEAMNIVPPFSTVKPMATANDPLHNTLGSHPIANVQPIAIMEPQIRATKPPFDTRPLSDKEEILQAMSTSSDRIMKEIHTIQSDVVIIQSHVESVKNDCSEVKAQMKLFESKQCEFEKRLSKVEGRLLNLEHEKKD